MAVMKNEVIFGLQKKSFFGGLSQSISMFSTKEQLHFRLMYWLRTTKKDEEWHRSFFSSWDNTCCWRDGCLGCSKPMYEMLPLSNLRNSWSWEDTWDKEKRKYLQEDISGDHQGSKQNSNCYTLSQEHSSELEYMLWLLKQPHFVNHNLERSFIRVTSKILNFEMRDRLSFP